MTSVKHISRLREKIFNIGSSEAFNELALEIFRYQQIENPVYASYLQHLGADLEGVKNYSRIPFIPISFFKNHRIISGDTAVEEVFLSSGTGDGSTSRHEVKDVSFYRDSFLQGFRTFYGEPSDYRFLALLPSYLERKGSSLVYMVNELINTGGYDESGFFLSEFDRLSEVLKQLKNAKQKTILIGVSFALLDYADDGGFPLGDNIIVMETGGMKGRREEITRQELHQQLCKAFGQKKIHSEYGMTELLSQAYSRGDGRFFTPPWMKVMVRDIQDPFHFLPEGKSGAINIIDLANLHSCSFIETQDIGRMHPDGSFEVLGRTDASDIRGCSLMIG